ncbi:conserved hypothetical protein [Bradyrhizobium oligotrophicum S58]|uniref:Uncharacterized protein n=1 Tax=Bradyrhizobium oligotrophicum S58 TaxID=1245469 RepID=M4ZA92_9BRAD|nr:hypothetical protein [Bradyrhizobium oligotrophicum]BAM90497.1 conserved hypothetical protein [Bradyrhizobium oligotrophicum S58]
MSTAELQIVYEPDDDGTGKVIASAKAGPFSAKGAAWFGRDLDIFLKRLRSYPLSSEKPPMIEGGYYDDKGNLKQCHVRIVIRPHDLRGRLLVQAELTSEVWSMPEAIVPNSASIRFLTEYAVLERFAAEFEELLKGRRQVAILTGTTS